MRVKTVVIVIALVLLLIVVLQNTQVVTLRFLFWNLTMSRVILLPLIGLAGFVVGYAVGRRGKKPTRQKRPSSPSQP
jgi:putative membrane protein